MSLRAKQTITPTGTAPTFSAATASDTMPVGPGLFAVYRSTHSATILVTAVVPGTVANGEPYPDKAYTMAIGSVTPQELWIPLEKYQQDPTTGVATVTCAPITAVTMAVVER